MLYGLSQPDARIILIQVFLGCSCAVICQMNLNNSFVKFQIKTNWKQLLEFLNYNFIEFIDYLGENIILSPSIHEHDILLHEGFVR